MVDKRNTNLDKAKGKDVKSKKFVWLHLYLLLVVALVIFVVYMFIVYIFIFGRWTLLPWAGAIVLIITAYATWHVLRRKHRASVLREFSENAGFSYVEELTLADPADRKGFMFSLGPLRKETTIWDVVRGKYQDLPVELFNYEYGSRLVKGQAFAYRFTVLRILCGFALPHLFLCRRDHGYLMNPESYFQNEQLVSISQEFAKRFFLLAPKGLHHEALQVFTQDFIQEILERWGDYDLELIGRHVCIYHAEYVSSREELDELFALGKYIIENVLPRLQAMQGSVTATSEYFPNKL